MEISSITSPFNLESNLTKAQGEGQNMDAFSELFAMLFGKMLIPSTDQYSFMLGQTKPNDSSENSAKLSQMLSIVSTLRTSGLELNNSSSIQSLNPSNPLLGGMLETSDIQKLFNFNDNVSDELKEFMNRLNGFSTGEVSDIANILTSVEEGVPIASGSDVNSILKLFNENTTEFLPKPISSTVAMDAALNESVMLPQNDIETPNSISSSNASISNFITSETANNVTDIKINLETGKDSINNTLNSHGEEIRKKSNNDLETSNGFQQLSELSNLKSQATDIADSDPRAKQAAIIKNPQDIIDFAVEKFKTLKLPGYTEVTVKLNPEDLGEVSLKLVLEKGQINGSISADRKEVVLMLQNNLDQLKTDLKNNNVNLNNLSVNIQAGEDFDRNNSRKGFSSRQNKSNHRVMQAFDEELKPYDLVEGFNIIA